MGVIDPLVIGNAVASGVIDLNTGPVLWVITAMLCVMSAAAVALAARGRRGSRRRHVRPLRLAIATAPSGALK
jgi:uncharacterized membrane protein YfcA